MKKEELGQLISDTVLEAFNKNIEYIVDTHSKELEILIKEKDTLEISDIINRIMTSYLRSSAEISVDATLKVLKNLGVEFPNLEK